MNFRHLGQNHICTNTMHFTLTDVSFDQKSDFSGAQVENLITKNVTKMPGLNLILTGSNVKFRKPTAP